MIEWTLQFLLGAALGWIYVLIVAISYYVGVAAYTIQKSAHEQEPTEIGEVDDEFKTLHYQIVRYEP